jgi:dipeptidyl aminopeptidase/acylaminoacyl peptidase
VFVAPFGEKESVRQKEWIPVTGDGANDRNPRWSPDGNLLYFLSERDGFRCVWAQRLDPRTKRPRGEPFGVQHFHYARLSLMHETDPAGVDLSVAGDRLVLSVFERTGNVWMLRGKR